MRNFIKLFIFGIFSISVNSISAQQIPLFNQYYIQPALLYPSASVLFEDSQLSLLYRGQFSGLEGTPQTFGLGYVNPLNNKLGYNINLNSHELGVLRQTTIGVGMSKSVLHAQHQLSFGLEAGISLFSIDQSRISVESLTDELIQNIFGNNGSTGFVSASISYKLKAFTAHVAMPNLLHTSLSDGAFDQLGRANRPDFSTSLGYAIMIDPLNNIRFSPQVTWRQYRVIGGAIDITGKFEYKEKFQITAGYREGFGSTAGLGVQIKPGLLFTYQYDFGNSDVPFLSDGFNELGLHFSFRSKKEAVVEIYDAGISVLDHLRKEEIYDKKLISEEDQSAATGYLSSLETGNKKEKKRKGEEAFENVLEEIKERGLAKMRAEADQRRANAEQEAREKAQREAEERRLREEAAAREMAKLQEETDKLEKAQVAAKPEESEKALDGDFIVVVGAFTLGKNNALKLSENLKSEYPQSGVFESKVRGYDYVYVMHFVKKVDAITAMRKLREKSRFKDSWVHVLRLSRE